MQRWFGLPRLLRFGLVVIAAGVAGDSLVHLSTRTAAAAGFTPAQHGAHLVVLIGMLVALVGVVVGGRRSREV
jgi:hypothetical protein